MGSLPSSLNVNDIQETCQKNAAAALIVGRRDVAKVRPVFLQSSITSLDIHYKSLSSDIEAYVLTP